MPSKQPRPSTHFRLDLGGNEGVGMFRECSGSRLRDLGDRAQVGRRQRPPRRSARCRARPSGRTSRSSAASTRASTSGSGAQTVLDEGPDSARVDGKIALIDYTGSTIATWSFEQGWPIKYTGATLNASGNEVAVEEIQICHEGLERM